MLRAISVFIDPNPIAIAKSLASRPGLALLHCAVPSFGWGRSFVMADPVETTSALLPVASGPDVEVDPEDTRAAVPRYVGLIPFECARSLERPGWTRRPDDRPHPHHRQPVWNRYAAVVEVDHDSGQVRVVGDDERRVERLARQLGGRSANGQAGDGARLRRLADDDPPAAHADRIREAQRLIRAGDLYQVNLARRLRYSARGTPIDHYARLAAASPAPFGACLALGGAAACATSPELFLELDARGNVRTAPIKGTRPRGRDWADDARLVADLEQSPKERAELAMIVDVERNDLGRVAATGSVRILGAERVQTFRTLHHRFALLGARLRPEAAAGDLIKAAFPSGSVTGAPKIRAMEVIASLEPARRGLYTGAIGAVAFDGSVRLAMAIRVLTVAGTEAHYFTGGGIVADSDPEAELAETEWKAAQLERAGGP